MPCSAVTLSLATITGIIATALLAIAFSTDNWLYTEVKRAQIQVCRNSVYIIIIIIIVHVLRYVRRYTERKQCGAKLTRHSTEIFNSSF